MQKRPIILRSLLLVATSQAASSQPRPLRDNRDMFNAKQHAHERRVARSTETARQQHKRQQQQRQVDNNRDLSRGLCCLAAAHDNRDMSLLSARQQRHNRDTTETQQRHNRDTTETSQRHNRDTTDECLCCLRDNERAVSVVSQPRQRACAHTRQRASNSRDNSPKP